MAIIISIQSKEKKNTSDLGYINYVVNFIRDLKNYLVFANYNDDIMWFPWDYE